MGFHAKVHELVSPSTRELVSLIAQLNDDPEYHGILVQAPVVTLERNPMPMSDLMAAIIPEKDVDGLNPANIGRIACKSVEPLFYPCTPLGIVNILRHYEIEIKGKNVVVLGRSDIVGMPMALMLNRLDATVSICHSQTADLHTVTRNADILVVAIGSPNFVQGSWIKPGAIVVDVGINRIGSSSDGKTRIVGDVDFSTASQVANAITPVPGGVGVMTVTMLVSNLLTAALRSNSASLRCS